MIIRWFRRRGREEGPWQDALGIDVSVEMFYGHQSDVPDDLNWIPVQAFSPRRYYVYAHLRPDGTPFYIGKGNGGRAWSFERHQVWQAFVEQRLQGEFDVAILRARSMRRPTICCAQSGREAPPAVDPCLTR